MNLAWRRHVDQIVGLNLNFISGWQESIEAHNEIWVALEKLGYTTDNTWSVYAAIEKKKLILLLSLWLLFIPLVKCKTFKIELELYLCTFETFCILFEITSVT